MTNQMSEALTAADSPVEVIRVPVGSVSLSGLAALHDSPRALVLALHGGGLHAGYFHGGAHEDLSLLTLGHQLGYSVIALDRPGYGTTTDIEDEHVSLSGQVALLVEAIGHLASAYDVGAGIFLVGHSFGGITAITLAAALGDDTRLLGLDVNGVGAKYDDGLRAHLHSSTFGDAELPTEFRSRRSHWGDEEFYPPATFDRSLDLRPHAPVPQVERIDAVRWPERVAHEAARVTVPVHLTFAEQEYNWAVQPDDIDEFAGLFVNSPLVRSDVQAASGHNTSLGWAARPYHLRAFAFAEDAIVYQRLLGARQ
ncbi:alpha/beta fold hydrolase [Gordonia sp. HNM0687]|uniref:Alpha/beta fold hydrolase n=1 Tax=Gordonia mangrovi TaxID=2665643 RepID=A0A6L7GXY4_9ACTN|nr:alpha/beta fold hydrolase [Gordonia mangrovi]